MKDTETYIPTSETRVNRTKVRDAEGKITFRDITEYKYIGDRGGVQWRPEPAPQVPHKCTTHQTECI